MVTATFPSRTCPMTHSAPTRVADSMASTARPVGVMSMDNSTLSLTAPASSIAAIICSRLGALVVDAKALSDAFSLPDISSAADTVSGFSLGVGAAPLTGAVLTGGAASGVGVPPGESEQPPRAAVAASRTVKPTARTPLLRCAGWWQYVIFSKVTPPLCHVHLILWPAALEGRRAHENLASLLISVLAGLETFRGFQIVIIRISLAGILVVTVTVVHSVG